ncbi:uncharacterized protein LOC143210184 isoform X2 [Lasioglossum baleicum]|uniref:uncharacterized protein LOC143210184 isoform X2 n=1 Tax=Lasioglossum baleicum TaxID=434251 RepID=UPI003FCED351
METVKRQRRVHRMSFTKAHTAFQLLEVKMAELNETHVAFSNALFQADLDDDEIAKELETDDVYKTNFLTAKLKMIDLMDATERHHRAPTGTERKTLKLPRIELPKFNGSVKEWLPFWSQFKKIHDDLAISRGDKFQYLLQATVPVSRASELLINSSITDLRSSSPLFVETQTTN